MSPKGVCEVLEYTDAGGPSPVRSSHSDGLLRKLCLGETKESQIFLHLARGGQRLIEAQCLLESGAFVSLVVEVFGILQEEPASPFQNAPVKEVSSFAVDLDAVRSISR